MNDDNFCYLCYSLYIRANRNEETIKKYADTLGLNFENFILIVSSYIEKSISLPDYVKIFNNLNQLETDEETFSYLNSLNLPITFFQHNLYNYFICYRPDLYYLNTKTRDELSQKIRRYEIYLYKIDRPTSLSDFNDKDQAKVLIQAFINSKYSKYRFCTNNNITMRIFNRFVAMIQKSDPDLYNKYVIASQEKEKRKELELNNSVLELLDKIKSPEGISIIDFFLLTDYDVKELVVEADEKLNFEDAKLFRTNISPFRTIKPLGTIQTTNILNTKFTIKVNYELIEVSKEDMITVIIFLKENNIPICNETLHDGLKKLYQNELYPSVTR